MDTLFYDRIVKRSMNMDDIYTENMYLAAALISYGADYKGVDRQDRLNQAFKFGKELGVPKIYLLQNGQISELPSPNFDQFDIAFTSLSLMFPPSFVDAVKRVKAIIHSR
jgi:hypothetical protein